MLGRRQNHANKRKKGADTTAPRRERIQQRRIIRCENQNSISQDRESDEIRAEKVMIFDSNHAVPDVRPVAYYLHRYLCIYELPSRHTTCPSLRDNHVFNTGCPLLERNEGEAFRTVSGLLFRLTYLSCWVGCLT